MSKRLPPLNALRVFDAAARHLSFTRAADELFVTQAAVSHQIKSLEDFLGLKLFRRRNRSLLLTEEGQSYFQDIKEIFSQLTEATRKLQARSAKGALTVSLLPSFAIQWLVPRLTSFNSAYPGIDVRIQAVDRQEDKLADDVDVAIFYGRGNWPGPGKQSKGLATHAALSRSFGAHAIVPGRVDASSNASCAGRAPGASRR